MAEEVTKKKGRNKKKCSEYLQQASNVNIDSASVEEIEKIITICDTIKAKAIAARKNNIDKEISELENKLNQLKAFKNSQE